MQCDIFILSSEWSERGGKTLLRYYGHSPEHGAVEILIDNYRPVFFVPHAAVLPELPALRERRRLPLRGFAGEPVDALYCESQAAMRRSSDSLRAQGITTYEADVRPTRRYLMERFIHAQARIKGTAVQRGALLSFRNPRLSPCTVQPAFTVASIDIETGVESGELYSIAAHVFGPCCERRVVYMRGAGVATDELLYCANEAETIERFLDFVQEADPDVIIGWNVIGFDLQFLDDKCRELGIKLRLGRGGGTARIRKKYRGGHSADVRGRVVIDGPQTMRYAFYTFEDFTLETVAQNILGMGKVITPEQDKIAEIERLFREDKPELARYNMEDCTLVSRIFHQTGLLDLCVRRAQISGLLLEEVGMSVAAFDHYMLPRMHRKGYVTPNVDDIQFAGHAAGGYIFDPLPGIHDNVVVLDFKSLYPSVMRSFRIDPLARLRADVQPLETPTGFRFSRTEHLLPEIIGDLLEQRAAAVRAGDKHLSQAIKILMNSFYGVMGTPASRFYHPDLPSAITGTGQWLLRRSREFFERNGYEVVYGDTDSIFVKLRAGEERNAAEVGRGLALGLTMHWQHCLQRDYGLESYLEMEYEKFYHKLVLPFARAGTGGAKKRYAGLLYDGDTPRVEFVGMEFVRTDWTPLARRFQYELYLRQLTGRDVEHWLRAFVAAVRQGTYNEELIYRKRLRKDAGEYTRNISPQVRAARMLAKPAREVRYRITKRGPVPLELPGGDIDYEHYIERQLRPIADSLLGLVGTSFRALVVQNGPSLFDQAE